MKFQYYGNESKEDTKFRSDIDARKAVLKVYNKQAIDFDSIDLYDDYLIEIEEKIDILMTGNTKEAEKLRDQLQKQEQLDSAAIKYREEKKKKMKQQLKTIEQFVQE